MLTKPAGSALDSIAISDDNALGGFVAVSAALPFLLWLGLHVTRTKVRN